MPFLHEVQALEQLNRSRVAGVGTFPFLGVRARDGLESQPARPLNAPRSGAPPHTAGSGAHAAEGSNSSKAQTTPHEFGAWVGLVPRQNSSGGKASLGRITKRGDDYLRTLLIQGAKSAVMSVHKRDDPVSRWLVQLRERVGWQKACVAMANKNARILWAVMTREHGFDPQHVSVKPPAKQPPARALSCCAA